MKKILYGVLFLFFGLLTACTDAVAAPKEYTVTFDSKGGSEVASQTVKDGEKAVKPAEDPTQDGFTFEYWYSTNEAVEFNFDTPITANITLSAKWIDSASLLFEEQFAFLTENNYSLKISINEKDKAAVTVVEMLFDGNVRKYIDGSYVAFYEKTASGYKMYEQQGANYLVTSYTSNLKPMFYYEFKASSFTYVNELFVLNIGEEVIFNNFLNLGEGVEEIKNLSVEPGDEFVNKIQFQLVVNGTTYDLNLEFSLFGEVDLTLPEVGA
ncbi:MAG TPA: InlB B-repeat-containing protein [Acholeplasma sp.]|nr:InlB B-repeat-containing protein [Acholeplasma sp.]